MKIHRGTVWTRRGCSLVWDADALASFAERDGFVSLPQLVAMSGSWPEDLPANDGYALVVDGLEGALDALDAAAARTWVERDLGRLVHEFLDEYWNDAALVFWLPSGRTRMHYAPASGEYSWTSAGGDRWPLFRWLWAGARSVPYRIDYGRNGARRLEDAAGLHHPRV